MINRICEICKEYNSGDNWVLKIYDEKNSFEFNGHKQCVDLLDDQVKEIKDVRKLSVKETLKLIKF